MEIAGSMRVVVGPEQMAEELLRRRPARPPECEFFRVQMPGNDLWIDGENVVSMSLYVTASFRDEDGSIETLLLPIYSPKTQRGLDRWILVGLEEFRARGIMRIWEATMKDEMSMLLIASGGPTPIFDFDIDMMT
jgi:hypothetical protein